MMNNSPKYQVTIAWSQEDNCYLVYLPDFSDKIIQPVSHGDTYQEALQHGLEVMEESKYFFSLIASSWLPFKEKKCIQIHTFCQLQTEVRNENSCLGTFLGTDTLDVSHQPRYTDWFASRDVRHLLETRKLYGIYSDRRSCHHCQLLYKCQPSHLHV